MASCIPLTALDAETEQVLWRQPDLGGRDNSPAIWKVEGKTCLLCNDEPTANVACIDGSDGKILWSVAGGGKSTVVVNGETMVLFPAEKHAPLSAYRLSLSEPELLWRHAPFVGRGESPMVYDGYLYVFGMEGRAICGELKSGRVAWETGIERSAPWSARLRSVESSSPRTIGATGSWSLRPHPKSTRFSRKRRCRSAWSPPPPFRNGRLY